MNQARRTMGRLGEISRRYDLWIVLTFVIAYLVRIGFLVLLRKTLFFNYLAGEALFNDYWGRKIAAGDLFAGTRVYSAPPLIMYYLGLLHWLSGNSMAVIRAAGALIDSINCVYTYHLGRRLFGKTVGVIAGLVSALYGVFLYYEAISPGTSLIIFLSLASFDALIRADRENRPLNWIVAGLLAGITALGRPNALIYLPVVYVWLWLSKKPRVSRSVARDAALFTAGIILILSPVFVRNYLVQQDFVFTPHFGIAMYLGYNKGADGAYGNVPFVRGSLEELDVGDFRREAETIIGHSLKPSEVSSFWLSEALKFARENPGKSLGLLIKKIGLFWAPFETSDDWSFSFFQETFPVLKFPLLSFGFISAAALLGLSIGWKQSRPAKLLVFVVIAQFFATVALFVVGRYRIPLVPFLIIFGSLYAASAVNAFLSKRTKSALASLFLLALMVMLTMVPQGPNRNMAFAKSYGNLAVLSEQTGDYSSAIEFYKEAIGYNPGQIRNYVFIAELLTIQSNYEEAVYWYEQAMLRGRLTPREYLAAAALYEQLGSSEKAVYMRKLATEPNSAR